MAHVLVPLSGRYLSLAGCDEIAVLSARGLGVCVVARELGRSASTVSLEVRRNASVRSGRIECRASTAQLHAERQVKRSELSKLVANEKLRDYVAHRLASRVEHSGGGPVAGPRVGFAGRRWAKAWSPEQISERLRVDFLHD